MTEEKQQQVLKNPAEILVRKKRYTHAQFNRIFTKPLDKSTNSTACQKVLNTCVPSKTSLLESATRKLPIIDVIRTYRVREMLLPDILAGVSVAVLHVPMGMGFGLLASLTPIYGLYTSFFPVLVYALFGTSPHTSFGSNAVIAVVVSGIVEKQANTRDFNDTVSDSSGSDFILNVAGNQSALDPTYVTSVLLPLTGERLHYHASVAAASSVIVGLVLILMGIFRLGILSIFFSDPLVSGFTFGASLQIAVYQVIKMLGLLVRSRVGNFKLVLGLYDVFTNIESVNIAALVISLVSVAILLLVKFCVNERFKANLPFPVPVDFLLVVLATIVSHFAAFSQTYELPVVNKVPMGLASPSIPELSTFPAIVMDSLAIVVLVFALSMSVAKFLAKQFQYSIDENQELIAYGVSNVFSGFFQCFPSCQAPPRAMLVASLNGKSTLSGIVAALVVLIVLLALGKYMEALPICVLASMIVVSLTGLYRNVFDTKKFWILNKWDFVIWFFTATVTTIVDIDIGLYAGIGISLITVVLQTRMSRGVILGQAEKEDYLLNVHSYKNVSEFPGIKIFQFHAPLYFGNAELFKEHLYKLTVNPDIKHHTTEVVVSSNNTGEDEQDVDICVNSPEERPMKTFDLTVHSQLVTSTTTNEKDNITSTPLLMDPKEAKVNTIILDLSRITYIDSTALKLLELVVKNYDIVGITLMFADCNPLVYNSLQKVQFFKSLPHTRFAHDVHAAILLSKNSPI